MPDRIVLTGGPGTGKTTTLQELHRRGFAVVPDEARALIRDRLAQGLPARPEPLEFAQQFLDRSIRQYDGARGSAVFFDYGILEPLLMLKQAGGIADAEIERQLADHPICELVFHFPAWRDIYVQDSERDHDFEHCRRVSNALGEAYRSLGFRVATVPCAPPPARADFILAELAKQGLVL